MNLSRFLQKKKMTAKAFAEGSGVNVATISRFLTGTSMPSTENVERILTFTGGKVTFDDLVKEFHAAQGERSAAS